MNGCTLRVIYTWYIKLHQGTQNSTLKYVTTPFKHFPRRYITLPVLLSGDPNLPSAANSAIFLTVHESVSYTHLTLPTRSTV